MFAGYFFLKFAVVFQSSSYDTSWVNLAHMWNRECWQEVWVRTIEGRWLKKHLKEFFSYAFSICYLRWQLWCSCSQMLISLSIDNRSMNMSSYNFHCILLFFDCYWIVSVLHLQFGFVQLVRFILLIPLNW